MSEPFFPDYFAPQPVQYQGHWKPKSLPNWSDDEYRLTYEFDAKRYVRELSDKMRNIEDDVAEPIIVDWLRSRGWTVEKEESDG